MTYGRLLVVGLLLFALALPGLSQEKGWLQVKAGRVTASQPPFDKAAVIFAFGYYGDHIVHYGDGGEEAARLLRITEHRFQVLCRLPSLLPLVDLGWDVLRVRTYL